MAGPRPKGQRQIQRIRVRYIITAIVTGARSLVEHFIRPVRPISRRPMSVNIFLAITAQALSEYWIPQQRRPLILLPAHQSRWTFKWEPTVAFITSLGAQTPL